MVTGSEISARITGSFDSTSGLSCTPLTLSTVWQKKQVTPWSLPGTCSRLSPSVVAFSRTAIGAWHLTQKSPSAPCVSRWPRRFIARKTGSLAA